MSIILHQGAFDPWLNLQQHQKEHLKTGAYGATASFVGTMRDFNQGDVVNSMTLEHYPGMTERELAKILTESMEKWTLLDGVIEHRVGEIQVGEPIVLVCVWSSHRKEAFEACRFLMEELKTRAPFWKKEVLLSENERWIDKNSDGY
ncbi:MAG: molybdenum cofactor biosynthesis protein MoaE [Gammaproteobacteria bacterium]|nr:molybdenum cofactor biosynthesis protein MoaE [Gammaproteobacteria bacterium]